MFATKVVKSLQLSPSDELNNFNSRQIQAQKIRRKNMACSRETSKGKIKGIFFGFVLAY